MIRFNDTLGYKNLEKSLLKITVLQIGLLACQKCKSFDRSSKQFLLKITIAALKKIVTCTANVGTGESLSD